MNQSQTLAPVLFVSHGAPTFALEPGKLGQLLGELGSKLDQVKAVAVVSPHWQTHGVAVMNNPAPATIHDFGGFPAELYRLQYPAKGSPLWALEAAKALQSAGFDVGMADQQGLDHGAWVPMMHLRPQADLPVFQISLPVSIDTHGAWRMGQALARLREKGVAIVGSGSLTHNLYDFGQFRHQTAPYALEFAQWVRDKVTARHLEPLLAYRQLAPHATRAHPTEEHFLPLFVAMGASKEDEQAQILDGGILYGMLSMESYAWGWPNS